MSLKIWKHFGNYVTFVFHEEGCDESFEIHANISELFKKFEIEEATLKILLGAKFESYKKSPEYS